MPLTLAKLGQALDERQLEFLRVFAKSCRSSILQMVTKAQSGHPGGSLSSIDFLSLIYAMRVTETNERVVISNGHISPAVYSVLGELGAVSKEDAIAHFRKPIGYFEGHVNRKVNGVHYGTGPLGVGASVAAGLALADQLKGVNRLTFLEMGDGELQEGQAYEMMNFAAKYALGNLILFVDYNEVQLTDSLEEIMPLNIAGHFTAAGWQVLEVSGHDFQALWKALGEAATERQRPTLILAKTVMGEGVPFMEASGRNKKADWHGKAPKKEQTEEALLTLALSEDEQRVLQEGLAALPKNIQTPKEAHEDLKMVVQTGQAHEYGLEVFTDCRSAYGNALLDLAKLNPHVVALTADLAGSVKTDGVKAELPHQHIECGIAEQHMVSCSGGLGLNGLVPFCSTFGAFMTSRAKDQARVNDINECNVKMVATHCGLSVGEDGPTHQAIDDISSFAGFFHTQVFEPADPNQCDRMIRYIAKTYGNFYVRMGRSKVPVLTKANGSVAFGGNYEFKPGKADVLREGSRGTILAAGPMIEYALKAAEELGGDIEVIAVSSFLPFDEETVVGSARKTGKIVTVHDHNVHTGLAAFTRVALEKAGLQVPLKALGVYEYQLSGTAEELYEQSKMGVSHIKEAFLG